MAGDIKIGAPSILVVGDECKSILDNLSGTALDFFSKIGASPHTAWELFQHANIVLVLLKHSRMDDLWLGRAMKKCRSAVPIIVLAEDWSTLESMSFGDVLLSASVDPQVLRRQVQAQIDATRQRAA